jgi:hypothetical protein
MIHNECKKKKNQSKENKTRDVCLHKSIGCLCEQIPKIMNELYLSGFCLLLLFGWNSISHPNLWEKLVWLPVISFCKIFIPSYAFDALLCRNWPFSPPNTDNSNRVLLSKAYFHLEEEILNKFQLPLRNLFMVWVYIYDLHCYRLTLVVCCPACPIVVH